MILTSVGVMLLCGGALAAYKVPQREIPVSEFISDNIEALADGESSFQGGPQYQYDCPGIWTGNGFRCGAENSYNCVPIPCL